MGNHAAQVQAIALSGQMHGVVLASESGQPLRPAILWADTRSSATPFPNFRWTHYRAI